MDISNLRQQFLKQNLKILRCPPTRQEDTPYFPILLKVLMVEERCTFPVYLKVSEGDQGEIKYLPYLEEGEILKRSWMESLERVGIERLYFHEQDLDRVLAYLNNHLLVSSADPKNYPRKFCTLREHLTITLHRSFKNPKLGANINLAKKSLGNLVNFMERRDFPWKLVWEMLYRDYTLYNHSVNVAVMGMALMVFLKKPGRDRLTVGLAGLFHDLGLTQLKEEIVNKIEPLDPDERELLKRHPELGYQLLKKNPQIPLDSLRLILEHHESADGSGYPRGLNLSQQHPYTRIIFILEMYDGLTTFRPYRPAHAPFAALKILQEQRGDRGLACESKTLKKFIQFLALS
jgi:HD-GYP domain-containing protein (c-di-GMP phosphodiesterase class II)